MKFLYVFFKNVRKLKIKSALGSYVWPSRPATHASARLPDFAAKRTRSRAPAVKEMMLNSRSWTEAIHSGNRKIQNLLKCPIFNGEHHDMIEIWKSQLIAEILSILYFNKNFMTDLSSKIVQQLSMTQHIRNYLWIRLNP